MSGSAHATRFLSAWQERVCCRHARLLRPNAAAVVRSHAGVGAHCSLRTAPARLAIRSRAIIVSTDCNLYRTARGRVPGMWRQSRRAWRWGRGTPTPRPAAPKPPRSCPAAAAAMACRGKGTPTGAATPGRCRPAQPPPAGDGKRTSSVCRGTTGMQRCVRSPFRLQMLAVSVVSSFCTQAHHTAASR